MTDEAKAAQAAYMREWRRKNPGKEREYRAKYWERKCMETVAPKRVNKATPAELVLPPEFVEMVKKDDAERETPEED